MGTKTQFITVIKDFVTGTSLADHGSQLFLMMMILCHIVFYVALSPDTQQQIRQKCVSHRLTRTHKHTNGLHQDASVWKRNDSSLTCFILSLNSECAASGSSWLYNPFRVTAHIATPLSPRTDINDNLHKLCKQCMQLHTPNQRG